MYLSGDRSYPVVLGKDKYFVVGDKSDVFHQVNHLTLQTPRHVPRLEWTFLH